MSEASITWIGGSVLRAITKDSFQINEAALVGEQKLLGEVIRIKNQEIVVQVYEDTSGLRPGDLVTGNGMPLAVKLGPALLGNIFDGLLRPLTSATGTFIQSGRIAPAAKSFQFIPKIESGELLTGGTIIGAAQQQEGPLQSCLLPPSIRGKSH